MSLEREDAVSTCDIDDPESYYSNMGVDVMWTGDLVSRDLAPGPKTTRDAPLLTLDPEPQQEGRSARAGISRRPWSSAGDVEELSPRRGFERYDLTGTLVAATIWPGGSASPIAGRVTNGSVTGMWIETDTPLPFRTEVQVEWSVMGGYAMAFPGRVVRTTDRGMAVHLITDDASWRFRSSFIDLARTATEMPPSVVIRRERVLPKQSIELTDRVIAGLGERWRGVEARLEDDATHQAFIHECLRHRRLEFALERYRELKALNPGDPLPTRYLRQIGTILTFYTLQRGEPPRDAGMLRKLAPIVAGVVLALSALLVAERITSGRLSAPPPPAIEAPRR